MIKVFLLYLFFEADKFDASFLLVEVAKGMNKGYNRYDKG